jgi:hypothetical protein
MNRILYGDASDASDSNLAGWFREGDRLIMEAESERETRVIREFWESLTPESLDELLKEITRKSDALLDFEKPSMPRKTRKRNQ